MKRPVLLLHGFWGSPTSFDAVRARIPVPSAQLLCPALFGHRGHAESQDGPGFELEVSQLGHWLEQRISEPVYALGYSMGGRLALGLAIRRPELVCGLGLISSRRGLDDEAMRLQRRSQDARWAHRLETEPLSCILDAWESQPLLRPCTTRGQKELRSARASRLAQNPRGLAQALRRLGLAEMPSYGSEVRELHRPVTLLVGAHDSQYLALSEELLVELPGGRRVVVDGAGHPLLLDAPEAVASAILEGIRA